VDLSSKKAYLSRINRVVDYVEGHLGEELRLGDLARIACFSEFHFHRIFKACIGETLNQFVNRLRLERAAIQLIHSRKPITDIALDLGFSSSSSFARSFRDCYGVSASEWRRARLKAGNSKICQTHRNQWKDPDFEICYTGFVNQTLNWKVVMNKKEIPVSIKKMESIPVAYIRHVGPYKGNDQLFGSLLETLCRHAGPRGLIGANSRFFACYHDDPDVTDPDKLRLSICLSAPEDWQADGPLGKMNIEAGTYAVAHFETTDTADYERFWQAIYGAWLPESGYQPDDKMCFEEYLNDPKQDPEGRHIFNICVPVKPL
jgi:AraC family transcriptional regulator